MVIDTVRANRHDHRCEVWGSLRVKSSLLYAQASRMSAWVNYADTLQSYGLIVPGIGSSRPCIGRMLPIASVNSCSCPAKKEKCTGSSPLQICGDLSARADASQECHLHMWIALGPFYVDSIGAGYLQEHTVHESPKAASLLPRMETRSNSSYAAAQPLAFWLQEARASSHVD